MNLLWHSDLVVSGGGTMNREAAALGVPVFSLFRGGLGAVDRQLNAEGRLGLITCLEDTAGVPLVSRSRGAVSDITSKRTLLSIVDTIEELVALSARAR
jgi:predicted glycosyltransferase